MVPIISFSKIWVALGLLFDASPREQRQKHASASAPNPTGLLKHASSLVASHRPPVDVFPSLPRGDLMSPTVKDWTYSLKAFFGKKNQHWGRAVHVGLHITKLCVKVGVHKHKVHLRPGIRATAARPT
ncbi:hypothetical protein V6N11_059778 [Hibiscus sabdariffa]|uniref:Secreted protein n=2 Tax=Hibiscus sabdariffa TaxID=183260 RepID=A0ABR2NYH5_9ROSI